MTTAIITGIVETKRIGRLQERLSTGITDKRQSKLEATRQRAQEATDVAAVAGADVADRDAQW